MDWLEANLVAKNQKINSYSLSTVQNLFSRKLKNQIGLREIYCITFENCPSRSYGHPQYARFYAKRVTLVKSHFHKLLGFVRHAWFARLHKWNYVGGLLT